MAKNKKHDNFLVTYQKDSKLKTRRANKRNVTAIASRLRKRFRGVTIAKVVTK